MPESSCGHTSSAQEPCSRASPEQGHLALFPLNLRRKKPEPSQGTPPNFSSILPVQRDLKGRAKVMPFGGLGFDSEWHRHKSLGSRSMEPSLAMHNPGRSQHAITCRCGEIPGLKFSQGSTGHSVALQPSFLRSSRRDFLGTPSSEWRAGINMWSRQGYAKLQPEALV